MKAKSVYTITGLYVGIMLLSYIYTYYMRGIRYGSDGFLASEFPFLLVLAGITIAYVIKNRATLQLKTFLPIDKRYFLALFIPLLLVIIAYWFEHFQLNETFFITLFATLLVGIGEELLFRRILLVYFLEKMPLQKAVVLSGLCFGGFHAINIFAGSGFGQVVYQVILTSIMGMLYGYLYIFTRKISWCIVSHGLWDYIAISVSKQFHPLFSGLLFFQNILEIVLVLLMARRVKQLLQEQHTTNQTELTKE
ncbi:CPBP family intramembrane glutamic endopeptidase [Streptococcus ruminantium]|uniref:CPBP family intramembrane glutamic endopeptidase n=1 Tax=Streptococcus ruminantium TaxID=1917441 RepID=UPI0012DC5A4F|nr:CPBP family intramembrane glutamic endopeptidase [Streptococcus ruminantium]